MTAGTRRLGLLIVALVALLALPSAAVAKRGDRDHDRLPDKWEKKFRATSPSADLDDDGLSNLGEFRSGTRPRSEDSDRDGILDGREDRDRDHVDNDNEIAERTNPRKRDTDRDRTPDGAEDADRDGLDNAGEDALGFDPVDPDTDDDGIKDGKENVGRVVSFEEGILTLRLLSGRTVAGVVDEATAVDCEEPDDYLGWDDEDVAERVARDTDDDELADEPGDDEDLGDDSESDDPDFTNEDGDEGDQDEGEDGSEDDASACSPEDLLPGTGVRGAELELLDGEIFFAEIELVL